MFMKKTGILFILLLSISILGSASADKMIIPNEVIDIQEEAFYNDTSITEVILPDHLLSIGQRAFRNTSLTHVFLPTSIQSIADEAFDPDTKPYVVEGSYAHRWAMLHSDDHVTIGKLTDGEESPISVNEDTITYMYFTPKQSGYYFFSFDYYLGESISEIQLYDARTNLLCSGEKAEGDYYYDEDVYYYFDKPFRAGQEYIFAIASDDDASGYIQAELRSLITWNLSKMRSI